MVKIKIQKITGELHYKTNCSGVEFKNVNGNNILIKNDYSEDYIDINSDYLAFPIKTGVYYELDLYISSPTASDDILIIEYYK